jgi:hypothetical protein
MPPPTKYFSDNRNTICAEIAAVLLKHKVAMAKASPGDAPVPTTEYGWFDWEDIEHFMKDKP